MNEKEIFTSLVRVKGSDRYKVVSVRSSKEIDKTLWVDLSIVLSRLYASVPIAMGTIICKNILNTGIDIVATRTLE